MSPIKRPVLRFFSEHEKLDQDCLGRLKAFRPQPLDGDIAKIWAFGLAPGGFLSYYVGLDWLEEGKVALQVGPKVEGLDFQAMFLACLESPAASRHLRTAYDVRASSRFIPCRDERLDITPLLVLHFLTLLQDLLRKPLKKGYVAREENLIAKLKGKILMGGHLRKNVFGMRPDRMMCRYQEFSVDCPENRLLHSAYCASLDMLRLWIPRMGLRVPGMPSYENLEPHFRNIGYLSGVAELREQRSNPLYREYGEALRLARLILRIQGYREGAGETKVRLVPPYVIDMPKLFELFVLARLRKEIGASIHFQGVGRYGAVDFLDVDRRLVIDAKYKPRYADEYVIEDVRQVAGYARDVGILGKLKLAGEDRDHVVDCLIIFPEPGAPELTKAHYDSGTKGIAQFHRMRKLGIAVPVREAT
ncbi:MAG: hypothetical protein WCQ50_06375 [Spirochaetota bacterium]